MPTTRTPIVRQPRVRITPASIAIYKRLRATQASDAHTCPSGDPPYPGPIFNSANPEHVERARQFDIEYAAYEAQCAACEACARVAAEEEALLAELGIKLRPWHRGFEDVPGLVRRLDAALVGAGARR
jgi:hypothetical protein